MFWKAYPWPWTRDTIDDITLAHGVQDYALYVDDKAKVWRMLNGRVKNTLSSGIKQYRDIRIMRHLEPLTEQNISWPNMQLLSYEVELDVLRFEAAISVPSGVSLIFMGEYQLFPPKVIDLASTINFPDYHLNVFCDGLLWMLYRLADDNRAGTAVKTPAGVQYTGQLGVFYDGLVMTKEAEEHGAGDTIYPAESIGGSVLYFPGIFSY